MIREAFRNEIENTLNSNVFFSCYDFKTTEEAQNNVKILYLADNRYSFQFKIPTFTTEFNDKYDKKYQSYYYGATVSPWASAICENVNFQGKESLLSGIQEWMMYLKEDLLNSLINRKIQEHEEKLNELNEIIDNISEEYLSENETKELTSRIDEPELNMEKNINELNKRAEEKEILIKSLKEEIEALKEKMGILNKKIFWLFRL
jgi:hypothetical protein